MFKDNLNRIMKEKNINGASLAKKTGFSKGAVSQWRNGIHLPTAEGMEGIAEALQCSVEDLLGGENPVERVRGMARKKDTLTCKEAAALMHKNENYVQQGLQEGRPGFEFGSAVKTSSKWSYFIGAAKFTEITGLTVPSDI